MPVLARVELPPEMSAPASGTHLKVGRGSVPSVPVPLGKTELQDVSNSLQFAERAKDRPQTGAQLSEPRRRLAESQNRHKFKAHASFAVSQTINSFILVVPKESYNDIFVTF